MKNKLFTLFFATLLVAIGMPAEAIENFVEKNVDSSEMVNHTWNEDDIVARQASVPTVNTITYELNGGVTNDYGWTSKGAVCYELMNDFNATYGTSKAWAKLENGQYYYKIGGNWMLEDDAVGQVCTVAGFLQNVTYNTSNQLKNLITVIMPEKYGWLKDVIVATRTKAGLAATDNDLTEGIYRKEISSIFLESFQEMGWPEAPSYVVSGTIGSMMPIWKHGLANPTTVSHPFVLNAPYKEGYVFDGWYTTPNFTGAKVVTLNDSTPSCTLYAKWIESEYPFGTCGRDLTWTLRNGVLTITGTGNMTNYGATDAPWYSYIDSVINVTFSNGITSIGDNAFYSCFGLTSINIPNSVTSIGNYAFSQCSGLISVSIPNSVTNIGQGAFSQCSGLTSVTIPNSVTSIGTYAFRECTGLTSVTIPNSVTSIGYFAFRGCTALISIVVEQGNTIFDSRSNCNAVIETATNSLIVGCKESIIPNSVTCVGIGAFRGLSNLTSITIPNSVTSIGNYAFSECSGLTSINISDNITSIGNNAFSYCSGLTSFTIGNNVTNIGEYVFWGCSGLTTITFNNPTPPTISSTNSFHGTTCDFYVPMGTKNAYVSALNNNIFNNDTISASQVIEKPSGTCGANLTWTFEKGVLTISGTGEMTNYGRQTGAPWYSLNDSIISVTFGDGITSIGDYAFYDCASLISMTIPNSVTSIGINAFSGCSGLTSITIPNNISSIGSPAFSGCIGLTSINVESGNAVYDSRNNCNAIIETSTNRLIVGCVNTIIPNNVTSIGHSAFRGCSNLPSVTIPNNVTNIESNAFYGCSGLTSVKFTNPTPPTIYSTKSFHGTTCDFYVPMGTKNAYVSALNNNIFNNDTISASRVIELPSGTCGANLTWTLENGVLTISGIGEMNNWSWTTAPWYSYKDSIISVIIPNSVTTIGKYAFYDCSGLTSVTIPNSVTSIGYGAFSGCLGLTSIIVESGNTSYDSRNNCNAIIETATNTLLTGCQNTIIPSSVTIIGSSAFYDCSGLTSVTIPNSVTSIGYGAFSGCSGLTSVTIPNSVTSIGDETFSNCSGLTSVTIPNGVTSIGRAAFARCSKLLNISLPNSLTSIDEYAFSDCSSLTSINIPINVIHAGLSAFRDCFRLDTVVWNAKNHADFKIRSFYTMDHTTAYYVESPFYLNEHHITNFYIGDSVEHVPANLCKDMNRLGAVTIGKNVNSFGDDVFKNCSALSSVVWNAENCSDFPPYYETIPFYYLRNQIISFVFGDNVQSIPDFLCYEMSKLASITLPESLHNIGTSAFYGCSGLTSVTIPNSLIGIEEDAFYECSNLSRVNISDIESWCGITLGNLASNPLVYARHLYLGDSELTDIIIPNSVNGINAGMFCNAESLNSINLPNSIEYIGDYAFYGCRNLTTTLPANLSYIGEEAFSECNVKSVTIPNSVTSFKKAAFKNCSNIDTLIIGNGITSISNQFNGCSGIKYLQLGENVDTINYGAFYDAKRLSDIVCFSQYPPMAYLDEGTKLRSFYNMHALVYVPCNNLSAYQHDALWGNFDLQCLSSDNAIATEGRVTVVPGDANATFTWPTAETANSYTLQITKDNEVFCTLTFNAQGQLQGIAFAPSRDGKSSQTQTATLTTNGMSFNVTGLDYASHYRFSFETKNAQQQTIFAYTGSFSTNGVTGVESTIEEMSTIRKIFHNGQLFILLPDGTRFDATGKRAE